jgi:hypothetical protein
MKRILLLLTLLLTINAKADNKSVEIEMVATAYAEPYEPSYSSYHGMQAGGILKLSPPNNVLNSAEVTTLATTELPDRRGLVYFKFNNSGKAKFELLIQNGHKNRKIKVDFNGLENEVDVPVTAGYQWVTVLEGSAQGKTDYSCLTIRNLTDWCIYVKTLRITADEKVIEGVSYSKTERDRLAPYLSLVYLGSQDSYGKEYIYNEITVFDGSDVHGTYFATLGWTAGGISRTSSGYSGLISENDRALDGLRNDDDNALMYAVWNTEHRSDDDIEYKALPYKLSPEATPTRFWWEDYGVRVWGANMDWKTEKTYCLLLNAQVSTATKGSTETATDTTFYTLYWKEKGEKTWRFHGTVMSPRNGTYLYSFHSFLENSSSGTGNRLRMVRYANQWAKPVDGEWTEILSAKADHDSRFGINRADRGIRVDGNGYILWSGGYSLPSEGQFNGVTYFREPTGGDPPVTAEDEQFFTRSFSTAISQIRNPKKVEYYDLNGNKVKDLRKHQIYITNTGEKVIFSR